MLQKQNSMVIKWGSECGNTAFPAILSNLCNLIALWNQPFIVICSSLQVHFKGKTSRISFQTRSLLIDDIGISWISQTITCRWQDVMWFHTRQIPPIRIVQHGLYACCIIKSHSVMTLLWNTSNSIQTMAARERAPLTRSHPGPPCVLGWIWSVFEITTFCPVAAGGSLFQCSSLDHCVPFGETYSAGLSNIYWFQSSDMGSSGRGHKLESPTGCGSCTYELPSLFHLNHNHHPLRSHYSDCWRDGLPIASLQTL